MRGALRLLGDAREPRRGVELLEPSSRGFELETAAVLIASSFTDGGQQQTRMRLFVRHLQLAPGLARLPQRWRGRFDIAVRKEHRAGGVRGRCVQ
jgi:hypothetical protein